MTDELSIRLNDGRKLGYAEYGDPHGKPILYFHGGISCRLDIAFAAEEFARRGLRIIAPDRPGIGLSDRQPDRTLLNWAKDVEQLLTILELTKIPVFGWSLGSAYVFPCTYYSPHLFSRSVTVGSCAVFDSPQYIDQLGLSIDRFIVRCPKSLRWVLKLVLYFSGKAPPHFLKREAENEVAESPNDLEVMRSLSEGFLADFLYGSLKQGPDGVIDDYWAVRAPWGYPVEEIKVPTVLFHGEEDKLAPVSGSEWLQSRIPGCELKLVPRAGHFLMHRYLDQVLDVLVS